MMDIEKLVNDNIGLIHKVASKFYNVEKDDLIQAGRLGLLKAYEKYNINAGTKFSTYAYEYIFGEMYLLANKKKIKVSRDILKLYKKIEKTRYEYAQELGYLPSNNDIANILNITIEMVDYACISAASILSIDSNNENSRDLYETIPVYNNVSIDDKILLYQGLEMLPPNEREILCERYFKDTTQSDIAKKLNMTQVMVSRLEKKGITRMREYIQN